MEKNCFWNINYQESDFLFLVDDIIKHLKNEQNLMNEEWIFNIHKSYQLIAQSRGWIWTFNQIIKGKLWPLLNPSLAPEPVVACTIQALPYLFKIVGKVIRENDCGLSLLCNPLVGILNWPNSTLLLFFFFQFFPHSSLFF